MKFISNTPKFFLGLATLASIVTTTAPAAAAVLVTVGGQQYNVDALPAGIFASNQSLLESQLWWQQGSLAYDFAAVVNVSLGRPNAGFYGPFFAHARFVSSNNLTYVRSWAFSSDSSSDPDVGGDQLNEVTHCDYDPDFDCFFRVRFAVATPVDVVPEPLTILGSIFNVKRGLPLSLSALTVR